MKHAVAGDNVTPAELTQWFRAGRARTKEIFAIPVEEAYFERPIPLRNPIVFYEGHLPAFTVNTLIKLALRRKGIDEGYEVLFARGIDPEDERAAGSASALWPTRSEVVAYGDTADAMIERALTSDRLVDDEVPQLRGAEAAFAILEHEQMHQETFLYMLHNLPPQKKNRRPPLNPSPLPAPPTAQRNDLVRIPTGTATLGADREEIGFGWDNEFPQHTVAVDAFSIQRHNVTNGEFLEFVNDGGYRNRRLWSDEAWERIGTGVDHPHFWTLLDGAWQWRGMFDTFPLPLDCPVYVTQAEAVAYARWRGMRLPTEAEYHRAAFGTPSGAEERRFPWGREVPDATRGNFDFISWDPLPVGSFPAGASAWGVHDLVGNGWEWTSTIFDGFPGFEPMASYPVYSNDFFDGCHYVLKGASPATARELVRRSFRNWFRPAYPYVYATFRCVK